MITYFILSFFSLHKYMYYLMFFVKIDNYALNLSLYNQKIIRTSENLISVWLQYWPSLTILLIKLLELRQLVSNWQYNFHLIILKEILNLSAYLFNCTCKYDVINSKKQSLLSVICNDNEQCSKSKVRKKKKNRANTDLSKNKM